LRKRLGKNSKITAAINRLATAVATDTRPKKPLICPNPDMRLSRREIVTTTIGVLRDVGRFIGHLAITVERTSNANAGAGR
jgi:hypothetical protein